MSYVSDGRVGSDRRHHRDAAVGVWGAEEGGGGEGWRQRSGGNHTEGEKEIWIKWECRGEVWNKWDKGGGNRAAVEHSPTCWAPMIRFWRDTHTRREPVIPACCDAAQLVHRGTVLVFWLLFLWDLLAVQTTDDVFWGQCGNNGGETWRVVENN